MLVTKNWVLEKFQFSFTLHIEMFLGKCFQNENLV